MTQDDPRFAQYAALMEKVNAFWADAVARQPDAFACREKCADCCQPGLAVRPVEAARIEAHLPSLPADLRADLAARAPQADRDRCVFLIDQRCAIYPVRPLLCRTHGLATKVDGATSHCPLNFTSADPDPAGVLDLERINTLLILVDRLFLEAQGQPADAPRVPLDRLAASAG